MGINDRRRAEQEALRGKIFNGASRLIIEYGYDKFSIRKLADEIEYSPAIIYKYYKNKDDIIKAITLDNYKRIFEELTDIDFEGMMPKTALKIGLSKLSELIIIQREQFRATLLSGINTTSDAPGENEAMNLLIDILTRGNKLGEFEIQDIGFTAHLLTTGVFGVISMFVINNIYDKNIINSTMEAYIEVLVKGVSKYEKR